MNKKKILWPEGIKANAKDLQQKLKINHLDWHKYKNDRETFEGKIKNFWEGKIDKFGCFSPK